VLEALEERWVLSPTVPAVLPHPHAAAPVGVPSHQQRHAVPSLCRQPSPDPAPKPAKWPGTLWGDLTEVDTGANQWENYPRQSASNAFASTVTLHLVYRLRVARPGHAVYVLDTVRSGYSLAGQDSGRSSTNYYPIEWSYSSYSGVLSGGKSVTAGKLDLWDRKAGPKKPGKLIPASWAVSFGLGGQAQSEGDAVTAVFMGGPPFKPPSSTHYVNALNPTTWNVTAQQNTPYVRKGRTVTVAISYPLTGFMTVSQTQYPRNGLLSGTLSGKVKK
jgi:hypothetical protein